MSHRHNITPEDLAAVCRARRIDTPCSSCRGVGLAVDGWRGGMRVGMPWDTCSACWGTGDAGHMGDDVRQLRVDLATAGAAGAAAWLAHRIGADLDIVRASLPDVIAKLERMQGRLAGVGSTWLTLEALVGALRDMAGTPRGER